MKTSVIEIRDMLSVLTVDAVEARFGEVTGVESATVNYAAGNVTVRYDETLLDVADIKVMVHQRGPESADESQPKHESEQLPEHNHAEVHTPHATPISASTPEPAAPKDAPDAPPSPSAAKPNA